MEADFTTKTEPSIGVLDLPVVAMVAEVTEGGNGKKIGTGGVAKGGNGIREDGWHFDQKID